MRKKIHFEIVSRYDKKMEPATVAVPLPKGELYSGKIKSLKLKKLPESGGFWFIFLEIYLQTRKRIMNFAWQRRCRIKKKQDFQ